MECRNTIDFLRKETDNLPEDFYDIFVVDSKKKLVGSVPLSRVLRSKRALPVSKIMEASSLRILAEMDQEEVAFLFRKRNLTSSPVINKKEELVGVITIDDVVDVIDEETGDETTAITFCAEQAHVPGGYWYEKTLAKSRQDSNLLPYHWYKRQTVQGAIDNGLPDDYIKKLEDFESKYDKKESRRKDEEVYFKSCGRCGCRQYFESHTPGDCTTTSTPRN